METIAEVLNINTKGKWFIENTIGDLVLIHYGSNATDPEELKHRGTVIDIKEKVVVAKSPGYTPVIVVENLARGINKYEDTEGREHEVDVSKLSFRIGREGVVIKVFKHEGKVYVSSHKKLDVSHSRLGQSDTFEEMYKRLGGPTTSLFDETKAYSPFCHTFIVSHRDLLIGSRINMIKEEGYLYYLGNEKLWDKEDVSWEQVELEPKLPEGILESDWIPIDTVNHHLRYGFHPDESTSEICDPKLYSGEFVVAYDQFTDKWFRFESPSYNFRSTIREKEVNLRYGFYKHLTLAMKAEKKGSGSDDWNAYVKIFPIIPYVEPRSIEVSVRSKGYIVSWPRSGNNGNRNEKQLIFNTWACYLLTCPLHLQMEVAGYYSDYYETRKMCSTTIYQIWKGNVKYNNDKTKAKSNIESIAISRIDDIIKQSQLRNGRNAVDPSVGILSETFRQNCDNLIKKERGGSLYAISEYLYKYDGAVRR